MKNNTLNSKKYNFLNSVGYYIMYLLIGIVPHIYRYMTFTVAGSESRYFKNDMYADLYMLAKSKLVLVLTILLVVVFISQLINNRLTLKKDKVTVLTIIMSLIIVSSSLFSEYQDIVYWGAKDRFEGMWMWLVYLSIFTVSRHYGSNKEFVDRLLKVFVISATAMSIIGIFQIFGYDVYTASFFKWLCFPKEIASDMNSYIVSNVTKVGAVGALYNSNYFGVYMAMSTVVSLYLCVTAKKNINKYCGVLVILNYLGLISSKSEAALLGFASAIFYFIIIYWKKIKSNKTYFATLAIALVISDRLISQKLAYGQSDNALYIYALLVLMLVLGAIVSSMLRRYENRSVFFENHSLKLVVVLLIFGIVTFNYALRFVPAPTNPDAIENLEIADDVLKYKIRNQPTVYVKFAINGINVVDNYGNEFIGKEVSENTVEVKIDGNIHNYKLKLYNNGYLFTINDPLILNFFYDGKTIKYIDPVTGIGTIQYPDRFDFYYDYGMIFSTRGYIWGTYMPVAFDNLLIGSGLDTHVMTFPQSDYIGKNNHFFWWVSDTIVDKPHSTYLMIFLSMGLLGVLAVSVFIISVGNKLLNSIFKCELYNVFYALIVVVMIAAVFNDSTIPISVLFFMFSGIVFSQE